MSKQSRKILDALSGILMFAAFLTVLWIASYYAGSDRQFREAMRAAAKPFVSHDDQVFGRPVEDVIRDMGGEVSEAIEVYD